MTLTGACGLLASLDDESLTFLFAMLLALLLPKKTFATSVATNTCSSQHYWIVILATRDKKEDSPLLPNLPIKGPILLRIT